MAGEHWNLQPNGNVYMPVIKGFRTAGIGSHVGLQIRTGPLPENAPMPDSTIFQVGLTPDQARQVADKLRAAADKVEAKGRGDN